MLCEFLRFLFACSTGYNLLGKKRKDMRWNNDFFFVASNGTYGKANEINDIREKKKMIFNNLP